MCAEPRVGVVVHYIPMMNKNDDIVRYAITIDPQTGLFTLNLTAQSVVDNTKSPLTEMVVQNKTVSINVTNPQDGTSWQVPGLLVLFTNPVTLDVKSIGLHFVDYTTGYAPVFLGSQGTAEQQSERVDIESTEGILGAIAETDPRGDAIPIHGIGLDDFYLR